MAVYIFRREATYYWRRRAPRALAIFTGRPHVFVSLRTTSRVMARRLTTQLDAILEDAAMLAETTDLHGGDTETSERYCEPHEIATLLKFVMELPVVTAELRSHEIKLLPWVAEKQVAPFSQPSRAKRLA